MMMQVVIILSSAATTPSWTRKRIALSYLRGWFAIDFFCFLPYRIFHAARTRVARLLVLGRPCSVKTS